MKSKLIQKELPKLRDLRMQLEQILSSQQKDFYVLMRFFNLTSPLYDEGYFTNLLSAVRKRKRLRSLIPSLEVLEKAVSKCGRDPYGMNRTKKGENVTYSNIYIGGIDGLNTHSVLQWMKNEERHKEDLIREGWSVWDAITEEARTFVRSKATEMVSAIDDIKLKKA